MPLYNYHCKKCNFEFTELRRVSEIDDPIDCPECGVSHTQRMLTGFAVGAVSTGPTTSQPANSPFR